MKVSPLFQPYLVGSMELRNRFIRSATTSYWSDERGVLRPEIINLYSRLAKGGVGLIIKGHLYVMDAGKAHIGMAGISREYHIPKLKALTQEVNRYGSKIVAQLNHAGIYSLVDRAGPSEYMGDGWNARALSSAEIQAIVKAFGDAADEAIVAGFDGVQIHGAHGYLVSQFLSRLTNQRTDGWGGTLRNRMRLLMTIYKEVRFRVGNHIPVLLKMNCDDFSPSGFTIKDSVQVAEVADRLGFDAIEVSGEGVGQLQELRARARSKEPAIAEAAFAGYAARIRDATKPRPLALVNGIRSRQCMEAILKRGLADLISMSRPFIREPNLVKKLELRQESATCTSCDACRAKDVFGKMLLQCHLNNHETIK